MKAVIGLGNPGAGYAKTRHNIGFLVVDRLFDYFGEGSPRQRFKSLAADAQIGGEKVVLLKPQTYMNLSGDAVQLMKSWYKLEHSALLVVMDEIDLPFESMRLRERGSAGGHRGLASILQALGTDEIARLRIGVGRGPSPARSHVLGRFTEEETAALPALLKRACDGVTTWITEGPVFAMNRINRRKDDSDIVIGL